MQVNVSFLSRKLSLEETLKQIDESITDYIHVDVCDGIFVNNKHIQIEEVKKLGNLHHKLDVHLMCSDPTPYILEFAKLNTETITIHAEIDDVIKNLSLIKMKGIKCGLAIKPETKVSSLSPYLNFIDNVIILGVTTGLGGQSLILSTISKINELVELRKQNNLNFLITFDGGINDDTIKLVKGVDVVIGGSFVINADDINEKIRLLR